MPELWGGVECSVVRIGDTWRDQTVETGHDRREDDLARIAALGIRTLRYPVLWERVAPDRPEQRDWSWSDRRLDGLRRLGIRPIVGLLHHGSGPRYTDLLDPGFPAGLAVHADAVAVRYPWITDWTPVNEPTTTARFSGLYGHWCPHHRDFRSWCRMVVNQCLGTVLAMRAIRRHIPSARLIQTEDLGRIFATPTLSYQAQHENERRWLALDLLCGRIARGHPWHTILLKAGIAEAALAELTAGDAAPDVIGINHYLTSDRFLDEAVHRYPAQFAGGNGRHRYADVEAVRVHPQPDHLGPRARLREAWNRYRRPLAITEAHHGAADMLECVRWLSEVWTAARSLRAGGVDIRAVTVWSLFGSVDWRSLMMERAGAYEPGPYDIRSSPPRATALATATQQLATVGTLLAPEFIVPGWWRREGRFYPGRGGARSPGKRNAAPIAEPVG